LSIYILSEKSYEGAKNLPCILIKYLSCEIDLDEYEALIFSSKNGVEAIQILNKNWKNLLSYSIGSGTSKAIEKYNGQIVYEARSSYGDDFAKEIKDRLSGKKVLFLRAKVVTSSLKEILISSGVKLSEAVIYETVCNECENLKKPEKNSCIVFSSPSTIECFFRCFSWDKSYKAVVIGTKSASYFPKDIPFIMSDKQNIDACIKMCSR